MLTTVSIMDDKNKLYNSNIDYRTTETTNYDVDSYTYLSSTLADRNDVEIKLNSLAEIMVTKNSLNETTTIVPFNVTYENVTSSTGLNVTSYFNGAFDGKKASSKIIAIDNCLKQPLKDILTRKRQNRRRNKVFETLKNKAKHTERGAQNDKIGYKKNRTRVTPSPNEIWQYVTLPPVNVSTSARTLMRGLNGFKASDQKLQVRTRELEKLHKNYGRFL